MNKMKKQASGHASDQNKVSDTHCAVLSGKRKFLRLAWVVMLSLSVICGAIVLVFSNKTTWVGDDGVLHEPLFGLMPISALCFFVGAVLALLDGIITCIKRR